MHATKQCASVAQVTVVPREKYPLGQTVCKVNEQRERTRLFTRRYLEEQLLTVLAGARPWRVLGLADARDQRKGMRMSPQWHLREAAAYKLTWLLFHGLPMENRGAHVLAGGPPLSHANSGVFLAAAIMKCCELALLCSPLCLLEHNDHPYLGCCGQ